MRWLSLSALLLMCGFVDAQNPTFDNTVERFAARFEPAEAKPGETVKLIVEIVMPPEWHTYPTPAGQPDPEAASQVTKLTFPNDKTKPEKIGSLKDFIPVGPWVDSPKFKLAPAAELPPGMKELRKYTGGTQWEETFVVSPKAAPGEKTVTVLASVVVCKGPEFCLPLKRADLAATLKVLPGESPVDPKYKQIVEKALGGSLPIPLPKDKPEPAAKSESEGGLKIALDRDIPSELAAIQTNLVKDGVPATPGVSTGESGKGNFIAFLLTAIFWGYVTLLTPCVFPMVPITVSVFLKQGQKQHTKPILLASVYTLTIVVVLGLAANLMLDRFRALSIDPWMNSFLGLLFVFFALSLFGMYDIVLPSFLTRVTSSGEQKGGLIGIVFMALSFTIVSFTCVAPFLGGFAGLAASGNFSKFELYMGGFAFAAAFASPFFFLALFPSLLKKMPKSGSWMTTIKVTMGFIELAAALKFFRTAELRWASPPTLFTYDAVLAAWVALLVLCALYLLALYRLPHDYPQDHIGVVRMMFAIGALALAVHILPGLWPGKENRHRPNSTVFAWVEAFLLPEAEPGVTGDLKKTIEEARKRGELVFLDFTGETCTNCKLNERNVFPKPEIAGLLKQYRVVQLYTDTVPKDFYEGDASLSRREKDAEAILGFQKDAFQDQKLPLYAILKPEQGSDKIKVIDVYAEGKINDEAGFAAFLKKPLTK